MTCRATRWTKTTTTTPAKATTSTPTRSCSLPTVSTVPTQIVQPSIPDGPVGFTVADPQYAASQLVVTASSSNQAVIPNSDLAVAGSGANRTITISIAAGTYLHGVYFVTLSATDPAGYTGTSMFQVVIDNAPTLNVTPNPDVISHGTTTSTVTLGGADADSGPPNNDTLTYTASLEDPLYDLKVTYGVVAEHPEYFDYYGSNEKWLSATKAAHGWLLLMPNNTVLNWDGSATPPAPWWPTWRPPLTATARWRSIITRRS